VHQSAVSGASDIHAPWFRDGLLSPIDAILNEPRIRLDPLSRLYVIGYTSLFNHGDEACDEWSFTFSPGKEQKLLRNCGAISML